MGIYSDKACANFREGYNCAQSVFMAFSDITGFDKETALKLSSSFGGGMGRLREVCGAVSSMLMVAGLMKGYTAPNNDESKGNHYSLVQDLSNEFKSECGSIICRDILNLPEGADSPIPSKRTEQYYAERPCENCIRVAAEIIERRLL